MLMTSPALSDLDCQHAISNYEVGKKLCEQHFQSSLTYNMHDIDKWLKIEHEKILVFFRALYIGGIGRTRVSAAVRVATSVSSIL